MEQMKLEKKLCNRIKGYNKESCFVSQKEYDNNKIKKREKAIYKKCS